MTGLQYGIRLSMFQGQGICLNGQLDWPQARIGENIVPSLTNGRHGGQFMPPGNSC